MSELERWVRREPIRHPEDVARLRSIMNSHGFDASDHDIQEAYSAWSEDTWAAGWMGLASDDDELFAALMTELHPEDPR